MPDTLGAMFVPAFTGLGAPYWDMYARGSILGITRGTTKAHICRAVLESIACESYDLFDAMGEDSGVKLKELRVDGGASRSRFLMQCQANLINRKVLRPMCLETTALGAAMLAGLATGVWENTEELKAIWKVNTTFEPDGDVENAENIIWKWHKAVNRSMGWAKTEN